MDHDDVGIIAHSCQFCHTYETHLLLETLVSSAIVCYTRSMRDRLCQILPTPALSSSYLADAWAAQGDNQQALAHAQAMRRLATCDGPPDHTYKVAYDESGALPARLGVGKAGI